MAELAPGTMVTPKLRLVRLLGEGAMGSVWIADHLGIDARVAVKFISPVRLRDKPALAERFEREAKAAARIKSPYVVQVHDHGLMADATPYIVMELLEGETLGARLKRGPLPLDELSTVVSHVGKALGKAHQLGVVHRDVKPDNIFLTREGDDLLAKVLDFGIAKQIEEPSQTMTQTGAILGTPMYMSPERIKSAREADFRADLWALAVVAYECATGRPPFVGETVGALFFAICGDPLKPASSLRPGLPAALDDWLSRALRHEPDKRFESAKAMMEGFQIALQKATAVDAPAPNPSHAGEIDTSAVATGEFVTQAALEVATDPGAPPEPTAERDVSPALESSRGALIPTQTAKSDGATTTSIADGQDRPGGKEVTPRRASRRSWAVVAASAAAAVATAFFAIRSTRSLPPMTATAPTTAPTTTPTTSTTTTTMTTTATPATTSTPTAISSAAPTPAATATATATATSADLLGQLAAAEPQFQRCYDKALRRAPGLRGTLTVTVSLDPDGGPAIHVGGIDEPALRDCVAKAVAGLPLPRAAIPLEVSYPVRFAPGATSPASNSDPKAPDYETRTVFKSKKALPSKSAPPSTQAATPAPTGDLPGLPPVKRVCQPGDPFCTDLK